MPRHGLPGVVPVSGQTYSRKVDGYFLSCLSGIAQSAMKFGNDLRILQSFEEMEEPFEKHQIGSSAMPYKRNSHALRAHCALARYVICDSLNPAFTAGTQWMERTLDDSANKRLSVSEAFLSVDAISEHLHERQRRPGGQRSGHPPPGHGKAALHGHGKRDDGVREAGRGPAGPP